MTSNLRIAALLFMLSALPGCAADPHAKPNWAEAEDIDLAAYDTFGWQDRAGKPPTTILDNRIRDAIREELTARGYVEATDNPDLLITHETIEEATVRQGNPVRIGIGVGSWGGNVGGSVGTSVDVGKKDEELRQMRVEIRALDRTENREAWVGRTAPLDERPEGAAVDDAVAGVMEGFADRRP